MLRRLVPLVVGGVVVGCGGAEQQSAAEREAALRAARADSVAMAEAMYDASVFDTISWESDNARWERGGVVWSFSCQPCHGQDGRGQGELAVKHSLQVPDLTAPDWTLAGDLEAIRHRIFVGHETEMPSWGPKGLRYSDVDAAAHYIDDLLRRTQ